MKAIVQDVYGSAEVLSLREVARPEVGANEVVIRVVAAGVDRGAWHLMTGVPYLMRGEGAGSWTGVRRQLRAVALSPFVGQKLRTFVAKQSSPDLLVLNDSIQSGKITPMVDRTFPLTDTPDAIRYLETGEARGLIVITM